MPKPPPISEQTAHVSTDSGKPTKEFYNWLKQATASWITADSTDTLTNKTIGAGNTLGPVTIVLGGDATGDIYYRNSSGILTRLPIGSASQVLSVAGSPALPSWQPAAQVWTLLNTLTASNSTDLHDTTSLTSTYDTYALVLENILPVTNNVGCQLRVHSGGAFQATGYFTAASITTGIPLSGQSSPNQQGSGAVPGISGVINVSNVTQTSTPKVFSGTYQWYNQGTSLIGGSFIGGGWNNAAAIDGFQILFTSGNVSSGVVKIYGIKG